MTHLGHNQKQPFSGLHQPGQSTNYKHQLTWVTTNNSPYQDYTNPDDQQTTNTALPGSQPTTARLRTYTSSDEQTNTNIDSPGSQSTTILLRTIPTSTISQLQTLNHLGNNKQSPSQGYTNPDDQPTTNIDSPGSQPTTTLLRTYNNPDEQTNTNIDSPGSQPTTVLLRTTSAHGADQSTNHKHWLTWVTTNNSPSQDYTNPDDQPTANTDSPWSQPTTVLLRSTPTRMINKLQTLPYLGHNQQQPVSGHTPTRTNKQIQTSTHLGHNQQQYFSGLHQHGRSANYKHWITLVTTNKALLRATPTPTISQQQTSIHLGHNQQQPFSGHTPTRTNKRIQTLTHLGHNQQQSFSGLHQPLELINQPITNTDSPGSQPTTALLRTTPTRTISQLQTLTHLGHNQQQSFSGVHQPGWSTNYKHCLTWVTTNNSPSQDIHQPGRTNKYKHWLTWVTINNNTSQDYTNTDDQPTTNTDSPW